MGTWGIGIKDCDEFYDCYEEFFRRSRTGKTPQSLPRKSGRNTAHAFPRIYHLMQIRIYFTLCVLH